MRAVNLIPSESGVGRGGPRSGAGAYALLGVLGVLLLGVVAYVLTSNAVAGRRAELAGLQTQVAAVQSKAAQAKPYRDFAALAQARVETVRQLGEARFDWQRALGDLSKVIPDNVWLSSLLGTVTTGVNVEGGSAGNTNTLRTALPNPAIELTGCTTDHDSVVRMISRMRLIDGVQRVALADSIKIDGGAGGGGGASSGDCRYGHTSFPQFDLVVFFAPLPALPTAAAATTSPTAPVATTTAAPAATPAATPSTGSDAR